MIKLQISKKNHLHVFQNSVITADDHRNQLCVIIIMSLLPFFSVKPAIKINFQVYHMQIYESDIHSGIHITIKVSIFYTVDYPSTSLEYFHDNSSINHSII